MSEVLDYNESCLLVRAATSSGDGKGKWESSEYLPGLVWLIHSDSLSAAVHVTQTEDRSLINISSGSAFGLPDDDLVYRTVLDRATYLDWGGAWLRHLSDGLATGLSLTVPSDIFHRELEAAEFIAGMVEVIGSTARAIGKQLVKDFPSATLFERPDDDYPTLASAVMGPPPS